MSHDPLTAALVRLADGDRSAFDAVYREAWPAVRGLCRSLVDDHDADDVAQTALLKVFERASEFDASIGAARPWLLGIAAWEARTVRRRRQRRRAHPAPQPPTATTSPEEVVIAEDLHDRLEEILMTMSEDDRATLLASMGQQDRPPISPATFRKRLQRATRRLRRTWRRSHG